MVTQTYATARWQQLTTHSGWVWLPPGYSVGWESMRAGGEAGRLPGPTAAAAANYNLIGAQGREWHPWRCWKDTCGWSGGRQMMRASSIHKHIISLFWRFYCSAELLVKLLFAVWKSCLPTWKISVTFKEGTQSPAEGHDYSVVLV